MINEGLNDIYPIGEILRLNQFMSDRQARELPKIEIGGTKFYLDLRLNEFRECDNFMNRLNLDDLIQMEAGYMVCFDPKARNLFKGSPEEYERRKEADLIWVHLSTLQEMDPLGFGWLMDEIKEGSPLVKPAHLQKVYQEMENIQLEKVLDKAGLLYKTKNHPPLLEKKARNKSKGRRL